MITAETKLSLIKKAKEWKANKTPLLVKKTLEIEDFGPLPYIGDVWETTCLITALDMSKFQVSFDFNGEWIMKMRNLHRIPRQDTLLPIERLVDFITEEEFLTTLKLDEPKFEKGAVVFLSPTYNKNKPSAIHPIAGTSHERHGKIIDIYTNKYGTLCKYQVRWFMGERQDPIYSAGDLITSDDYYNQQVNKITRTVLKARDPLVTDGSEFVKSNGYYASMDDSVFISEKFKHLFQ
jgi:hypothetical protein